MSIIFPLFGTGTPQGIDTDGYFRDGTDLKRIKSESFEIDTLFSNVSGFFVDRKENLYTSGGGNVKKYRNIRGNLNLVWQISGGFSGGATLTTTSRDRGFNYDSYPFTSDFQNVAVDSQFNFYFRDTTDSNKLKKYSAGGQLITSTSSDIGVFAINRDGIFSFSGNTVTKRNLSGNSISSFSVTGSIVALSSNQVFTFENSESFDFRDNDSPPDIDRVDFITVRGYDLSSGNQAWLLNRFISFHRRFRRDQDDREDITLDYKYIPMKNGNLLMLVNAPALSFRNNGGNATNQGNQFYGYVLISPTGQILHISNRVRFTGAINGASDVASITNIIFYSLSENGYFGTDIAQYLTTQGSNSDRSRLNF